MASGLSSGGGGGGPVMAVTRDQVAREFGELLVERFSVPPEDITPTAHLFDDLHLDSIDLLSALAIVEDRHGVSIPDEDLSQMLVVDACVDRITALVGAS